MAHPTPPQQAYGQPQYAVPQQGGAQPPGYTSTSTGGGLGFGRIVVSEWTKIRTVRSTTWTLLVMAVIIVGMAALVGATASASHNGAPTDTKIALSLIGVMIAQIAAASLGVLTISAEYTTGMIRSTLTAYPRRGSVLAAKALVFGTLMFAVGLVSCLLAYLVGSSLLGDDVALDPTNGQLMRGLFGSSVYLALIGLFSLGVGTMLRHSAGAITTVLGVILLPSLFGGFIPGELGDAIVHYNPMNLLLKMVVGGGEDGVGGSLGAWPGMILMAGYAAAALAGGLALLKSRDV